MTHKKVRRLLPGQFKGGKLVKDPKFQDPKQIKRQTEKLGLKVPKTKAKKKKGKRAPIPTGGGFTPIGDIQRKDVLPEFRQELGVESTLDKVKRRLTIQIPEGTVAGVVPGVGKASKVFNTAAIRRGQAAIKTFLIPTESKTSPGNIKILKEVFKNQPELFYGWWNGLTGAAKTIFIGKLGFNPATAKGAIIDILKGTLNIKNTIKIGKGANKARNVGRSGITPKAEGILKTIAQNTKTTKIMIRWITGIAATLGLSIAVVNMWRDNVGTRVYTGFVAEETSQILGFAYRTADANDDFEGAQDALDMELDVIAIMRTGEYKEGLAYGDAIKANDQFIEAAALSNDIRQKALDDKIFQIENNETDDDKWARIREEEAEEDKAVIEFYNVERKKLLKWEEEAKDRDMKEDAAFWALERAKQSKLEQKDREAMATFWIAYRKEAQRIADSNRPSALNFGLL